MAKKSTAHTLDIVGEAEELVEVQPVPKPTVYLWDIPGENGYSMRIEVESADDIEHARSTALAFTVPLGTMEKDHMGFEHEARRPLTSIESQWVRTIEPQVVVDSSAVTMGHGEALKENERLRKENEAFDKCREVFAEHSIDVYNPGAFIDSAHQYSSDRINQANKERDERNQKLVNKLLALQSAFDVAIEESGCAPPKPEVPAEPDYSGLTIFVDDIAESQYYPRLNAANFVERVPTDPLDDDEKAGLDLILREYGILERYWRQAASETEIVQIKAIMGRIKAVIR